MADELTSRARPISAAHADQYLVVSRGEAMRIRLSDLCERGYGFDGAAAGSRLATGSSARIVRLPCVRTRRLAVVSLSKEFLAHRRHQTPRRGCRRARNLHDRAHRPDSRHIPRHFPLRAVRFLDPSSFKFRHRQAARASHGIDSPSPPLGGSGERVPIGEEVGFSLGGTDGSNPSPSATANGFI
jgi:hypothetical protein